MVRIIAIRQQDNQRPILQVGTGFFISPQGHILTNANILEGASEIYIEYKAQTYFAKKIGEDEQTNMAILQTEIDPYFFDHIHLTDSPENLSIGSFLVAITCKMGLDPGPSYGLLNGSHLYYGDQSLATTHIRSDIPSDGGEGGSPVFDINGHFVGMMVISLIDIRSSFILPAKAIMRIKEDILYKGVVEYGYLGIRIDDEVSLHPGQPLLIAKIMPDSPAQKAGILPNDVLLYINGVKMNHLADLHNVSFFARPGSFLNIEVYRKGKIIAFSTKVEKINTKPQQSIQTEEIPLPIPQESKIVLPDHQPNPNYIH